MKKNKTVLKSDSTLKSKKITTLKKVMKFTFYGIGILLILILIYTAIPRISNPSPEYQTELTYGEPVDEEIKKILTPKEEPKRTRSVVILENGKIIYEYGPTDKIMNTASVRKAILGVLYGIAVDKGLIDINKTLAELNIDEVTPLTEQEKTATIEHLLMFKSGIYLPAQGEHDAQITDRPLRERDKPGEYFFANNFDANALGTIFMQETGMSIGKFMEEYLAKPIGLQDFTEDNVILGDPWFWPKKKSKHKQYYIYLSTRDLARIGAMVANDGRWNGKQIISKKWIEKSTTSYSNLKENHITYGFYDGFGYQWWISSNTKTVWADGYGGRFLMINPSQNLVLVEQNFTGNSFLSTGLWLMNGDWDNGLGNLIKAHHLIVKNAAMNVNNPKY
ncbi:serine hydrolase [Winogradskyella sp.]|uniref:serine hydrolase domain-containing protein n=1 Tax=Winogradskyella sp. TaxID=1883156 RepID=UPI002626B6D7|nr:serine hydrolase [Winogradskyella sp.]